jgi:hypothetical protein
MKLGEIYRMTFQTGIAADPRGADGIARILERGRRSFEDLPERKRWEFDQESLVNPFADTRILVGDPETDVSRMLVGIDLADGEVLLADRLRAKGTQIDLLFAHHPEGCALARLEEVMSLQADVWRRFGVSIAYGDAVLSERMAEIMRAIHPRNNEKTLDVARLLDLPYMCCHTPADNSVNRYVQQQCDDLGSDATVGELLDMLKSIPEYREAVLRGAGPALFEGDENRRTGKTMVDMTGGTSGPVEALSKLAAAGVGTLVGMHMGEDHRKKAKEEHLNVVIAGHMSSDSLGMNLIVDQFEREGVEIVPCGGFTRVSRA